MEGMDQMGTDDLEGDFGDMDVDQDGHDHGGLNEDIGDEDLGDFDEDFGDFDDDVDDFDFGDD